MLQCNRHTFDSIPLLLGVVGNEGYAYVNHAKHRSDLEDDGADESDVETVDEMNWRRELRVFVRANWRYHQQKILDVLAHNYNDWENEYQQQTSNDERDNTEIVSVQSAAGRRTYRRRSDDLAELIGDGQFAAPTIRFARVHSTCGRVTSSQVETDSAATYLYAFDGHLPTSADGLGNGARIDAGGGYKRDLAYAFGAPLADGIDPFATNNAYTDADRKLARTVLIYWTNFIRTGSVICIES
jgi:carboxylesterase type B